MAERKSFLLRMDPALWADLEAWAQDELRSVNGQIEYILKQAVQKRRGTGQPSRKSEIRTPNPETKPKESEFKQEAGETSSPLASNLEGSGPVPRSAKPEPGPPDSPDTSQSQTP